MVTMHEGDHLVIMGMRLRVQLGRITEMETTYYRQGGGGPSNFEGYDKFTPEPIWFDKIPAEKRVSRAQLINTANMYFAGLENNDGKGVYPFADDCDRMENGVHTTNNPTLSPNAAFNAFGMSCMAQFKSGYYAVVTRILIAVFRWSTKSAASSGPTSSSTRMEPFTTSSSPTAKLSPWEIYSIARPASKSPKLSRSPTEKSAVSKWSVPDCSII